MSKTIPSTISGLMLSGLLGFVMVPGCFITIEPGTDDGTDTNTTGGSDNNQDGGMKTPQEEAAELFAQMDPQELAVASAEASLTTCSLVGSVESLGLDPATLDEATLTQLMEDYLPLAAEQAGTWLATIDPSALPLGVSPRWDCHEPFGCAYRSPCIGGILVPTVPHVCYVTDCGDAKCGLCPDYVADILKNLAVKTWCAYVCIQLGTAPPKVVAIGAGGISKLYNYFIGPLCVPNW